MLKLPGRSAIALKLESDRMIYLDLIRVGTCYLIIAFHFQNQMALGAATERVRAISNPVTLLVDLFFFISGFVIASVYAGRLSSRADFRDYMAKRLARVMPLHWATFAIFALFGVLSATGKLPSNHPELYDPRCIVPNFVLLHAFWLCHSLSFNYVSWSISAEMAMYILFPVVMWLAVRRALGLFTVAALLALLTAAALLSGTNWLDWSFDGGVARAMPSFLFGAVAYQVRAQLARIPRASWLLAIGSILFIAGCIAEVPRPVLMPLAYAVGLLGIGASEQPVAAGVRRIAPLGQLTYSLYMLHPLVQTVVLTGIGRIALKLTGWQMNLFVAFTMVLMIPITWTSLVLFERPARRWMTKRLAAKPTRTKGTLFTPDSRW